jgi:integrase
MMDIHLREELARYLSLREAMGFPTVYIRPLLEKLVDYLDSRCKRPIRAQNVLEWACSEDYSPASQSIRLSTARVFLKHLSAIFPGTEIPDRSLIAAPRRPEPLIFSTEQLVRLMSTAGKLNSNKSLEPLTVETLIGLMACTGMRPGEVLRLKIADASLNSTPPRLFIERSKFQRSRWVPLHPTASKKLQAYLQFRQRLEKRTSSNCVFVTKQVHEINYQTLRRIFLEIVQQAGIQSLRDGPQPGLNSLRHTFAVHRLQHWYEIGADVRSLLPNLSVYMGHKDPVSTYWYLSCTPELMTVAAQRFETYASGRQSNEDEL